MYILQMPVLYLMLTLTEYRFGKYYLDCRPLESGATRLHL